MLQGTGSDVGKSLLTAGLCRLFADRGLKVLPFKPQNMSNNAAVADGGGEIGRAQALQARACRVRPSVHMNPVLLKPQSDLGSQVIVQGQVRGQYDARGYWSKRENLMPEVMDSFAKLCGASDLILIEGAGSPAEVNLRRGDIANMGFAEAADVPVVLVGDIDRGGVIASIVGTAALLPAPEVRRIGGFIINKFRGDLRLFDDGLHIIEERTGIPPLGVVPFFPGALRLPAEDAIVLEAPPRRRGVQEIRVAVPVLPRIANFDDLDPLRAEPDVEVLFVGPGQALPGDCDLIVLPGSKATLADLAFLRAQAWDQDILAHVRRGGAVLGLCGGYQMLGQRIEDPEGIEGAAGSAAGLGLLDIETVLAGPKTLKESKGSDLASGQEVFGYEIHMGRTSGPGLARAMLQLAQGADGAVSADGRVSGCYLHGLFGADGFRREFLNRLRPRHDSGLKFEAEIEKTLDSWALHLERHLDIEALWQLAERGTRRR